MASRLEIVVRARGWRVEERGEELSIEIEGLRDIRIVLPDAKTVLMEDLLSLGNGCRKRGTVYVRRSLLRRIRRAREWGERIQTRSATVILYGGRVFFDGCWDSPITTSLWSVDTALVERMVEECRAVKPNRVGEVVKRVLEEDGRTYVRRLARNSCVVEALSELVGELLKRGAQPGKRGAG